MQDPLHKEFGLPTIEDNVCEGLVYEPEVPRYYPSGKRMKLKAKNIEFCEKASHRKPRKTELPHEWTGEGVWEREEMELYINVNRLRNVLSHEGDISQKMFGKVQGLLAKDVFKDYLEDRSEQFSALSKKEQDLFKKEMQRKCAECIRPNFVYIVDGEF